MADVDKFDMSYNDAICIQRAQLAYYRNQLGYYGTRMVKNATKPCPAKYHPNDAISIFEINNLVPRGGDIEGVVRIRNSSRKFYRRPLPNSDPLNYFVHKAIIRGLL